MTKIKFPPAKQDFQPVKKSDKSAKNGFHRKKILAETLPQQQIQRDTNQLVPLALAAVALSLESKEIYLRGLLFMDFFLGEIQCLMIFVFAASRYCFIDS